MSNPPDHTLANIQRDGKPVAGAGRGNERAVSHGGHSDAIIVPRARDLAPVVFEANGHLDPLRDGPAVLRYSVVLARIERAYRWLAEQRDPVFRNERRGEVHGVYERLERWERAANEAEDRLAISPLTRTKLGLDRARGAALVEHLDQRYGGKP